MTEVASHLFLALRCLEASEHQVHELIAVVEDQSQQIERLSEQIARQSQKTEGHGPTPFEWKIPIYQVCQKAGMKRYILYSKPFNLFGYYFLLKTEFVLDYKYYFFSSHIVLGKLYIKVVPGEFDESLSWPCKEKVRVTVIDQDPCQDDRENRSHVIDFDQNPFSRPLFDDNRGYIEILNLRDFIYTRSFIRDDTVIIMVQGE